MNHPFSTCALFCAVFLSLPPVADAVEIFAGPVSAEVVRVVDGDTIAVEARPWPGQIIETLVRVRGVDTREVRAACG
ncbi:MAG: thermonuclease family protein, partial [Martelella sp.]